MVTEISDSGTVVIGVVADPDLPASLARDLARSLPAALTREDDGTEWRVEVFDDPFEAMYPDVEYVIDKAARHVRDTSWDLALCLTDLPMRSDNGVMLASLDLRHHVALIPLPALGGLRLRSRLRDLAAGVVAALRAEPETSGHRAAARTPFRNVRIVDDGPGALLMERSGPLRTLGLLAGMVRANRPWRLFVGLSSALAGSLAGIAFGVLYSNIWQLATALGPLRLTGVVLAAIAALAVWIVVGHSLWERRTDRDTVPDRDLRLRNTGTAVTVALGAVIFYAVLLCFTCAAVALVIPPSYLETVIGGPVGLRDYLMIAAMATVLGTVAGAVGSGLEDDLTVRKATYGYRDRERRSMAERRGGAGRQRDPQES